MEYFNIGKIVATHGLKGEVLLKHSLGNGFDFKKIKALFLEDQKEFFLPWFIKDSKKKNNNETFFLLEGIDNKEEASRLLQKGVWLKEEDFHSHVPKDTLVSLLGYKIIQNKTTLGEIVEVIEQSHQTLCRIMMNDKEAWIPLHPDFLIKIDRHGKSIHVKLPDGLLDVYKNI